MLFLDVMMPEMDGYETCRRLRENPETRNIPVVMVTALRTGNQETRALRQAQMTFSQNLLIRTEVVIRTKNLLRIKEFEDFLKQHNEILEKQVQERTAQLVESRDQTERRLHRQHTEADGGCRIQG